MRQQVEDAIDRNFSSNYLKIVWPWRRFVD